jgi:pyruvate dehydrogenase E1 component alpha subunit
MPDPEPLSMFDDVYVESTPHLDRQRENFARYLGSFEGAR